MLTTAGGYTQIIYPISKGYKLAWVKSSELEYKSTETKKTVTSNQYTKAMDKMMSGSAYNGLYKLNTRYRGPYAKEQCKGFAKSVHEKLFGYNIGSTKSKPYNYLIKYSGTNTSYVGSVTSMSTSSVKTLFSKARPGDFVQMRRKHTGSHSAIIYSVASTGVTFYEANIDGKNGIVKKTYTWSELCRANAAMSLYTAKKY